MKWLLIFVFFISFSTQSQTLKDKNRVSPSYSSVVTCFPTLKSKDLEKSFSLKILKERMDQTFPSASSEELSKLWVLKDQNQNRTRVTVKTEGAGKNSSKLLTVEKLDEHDVGEIVDIPASHKINPPQKIISSYLYKNTILKEETQRIDTKLNGLKSSTKQNGSELVTLELWDSRLGNRLHCETKEKLGVICLCEKK